MSEQPPAGWYPDPHDQSRQRYWDGTQWTDHAAPQTEVAGSASWPQDSSAAPSLGLGDQAPDPWLWQSITTTVLCCFTTGIAGIPGIVGIVFASQSQSAAQRGDLAEARSKARAARNWTIGAIVAGVVLVILLVVLVATLGASGFQAGLESGLETTP